MKLSIYIIKDKKEEINKYLLENNFDLKDFTISENKRRSVWILRVGFYKFKIKAYFSVLFQNIKELIRYKRIEPRLGGGGLFNLETFYGFINQFFVAVIFPGIAFDLTKTLVVKIYHLLKSEKVEYLQFITQIRQPFDTRVKILIPNNLEKNELDWVLAQAGEILNNIDKIRCYFGYFTILVKFDHFQKRWLLPQAKI